MKSFKKVVSIILVISIIASLFAISASAFYGNVREDVLQNGWLAHKVGNNSMLYQFELNSDRYLNYLEAVIEAVPTSIVANALGKELALWAIRFFPKGTSQEYNSFANQFFYIVDSGLEEHFAFYNFGLTRYGYEQIPGITGVSAVGMQVYQWDWTPFLKDNEDFKLTYQGLNAYCNLLQKSGFSCFINTIVGRQYRSDTGTYQTDKFYVIQFNGNVSAGNVGGRPEYDGVFACDESGRIYVVPVGELEGTVDTGRNNYTASSGGDQYILDIDPHYEPTININDDDILTYYDSLLGLDVFINSLSYNPETNNYSLGLTYTDSSTHITNNYDIRYTYYIDYTSVTYIGQSAEYDKTYKIYYELPDGRSSADLTAEELEQLSLEFDVINYGKSADDGRLRALYHFDGNTEDSSYYASQSSFNWDYNASVSYLESPNFEGCLYLDERSHVFTITLPSNLSSGDFSVLFRYYHSANANKEADFEILSGNTSFITFSAGPTSSTSDTPLGTWSEVGMIRDGAVLRFYINGLQIYSYNFTTVLGNTITFSFADVPVYRYFDELRVFNYAIAQAGADYTPIIVPQTTNAVLVLPDEGSVLPDPYWEFNTDGNLFSFYDYSLGEQFFDFSFWSHFSSFSSLGDGGLGFNLVGDYFSSRSAQGQLFAVSDSSYFNRVSVSTTVLSDFVHFENTGRSFAFDPRLSWNFDFGAAYSDYSVVNYPFIALADLYSTYRGFSSFGHTGWLNEGQQYTFQLVDVNGKASVVTFIAPSISSLTAGRNVLGTYNFDWGSLVLSAYCRGNSSFDFYYRTLIMEIRPNTSYDLVYAELKKGSTPNDQSNAYKTVIYSDQDISRRSIAVRSLIPVRSSRIGGVRPTLPYRGDVWCQIQNGFITSCQIYTGFVWQEVDCRIWTGQRWVWPLYYNVRTLQDIFDVEGTTDTVYIQDDSGYYSWITRQWASLLDLLNTISDKLSGIGGGNTEVDLNFTIGDLSINIKNESDSVVKLLIEFLGTLKDLIFDGAFDSFTDNMDDFKSVFDSGGDTIDGDPSAFSILESGDVWV